MSDGTEKKQGEKKTVRSGGRPGGKGWNTQAQLLRLGRGREQICLVCSAALESFRATWTLSAPIQHAKSEKVGCRLSEPLDSLIGCVTILIGGVLTNQHSVWKWWNTVCALFFYALLRHFLFSCSATSLLHLAQAQKVHATVKLAGGRSGVFNATFLLNGSDKRQQSGWIKAVGCWFESGRCVGASCLRERGRSGGLPQRQKPSRFNRRWRPTARAGILCRRHFVPTGGRGRGAG